MHFQTPDLPFSSYLKMTSFLICKMEILCGWENTWENIWCRVWDIFPWLSLLLKMPVMTTSIPAMQSIPEPSILEGMEAGALTLNIWLPHCPLKSPPTVLQLSTALWSQTSPCSLSGPPCPFWTIRSWTTWPLRAPSGFEILCPVSWGLSGIVKYFVYELLKCSYPEVNTEAGCEVSRLCNTLRGCSAFPMCTQPLLYFPIYTEWLS